MVTGVAKRYRFQMARSSAAVKDVMNSGRDIAPALSAADNAAQAADLSHPLALSFGGGFSMDHLAVSLSCVVLENRLRWWLHIGRPGMVGRWQAAAWHFTMA